jgi:hypothetical protein
LLELRPNRAANTQSGLKLPSPAPNRSQNEQKFFWFFFFKKRTASLPPLAPFLLSDPTIVQHCHQPEAYLVNEAQQELRSSE